MKFITLKLTHPRALLPAPRPAACLALLATLVLAPACSLSKHDPEKVEVEDRSGAMEQTSPDARDGMDDIRTQGFKEDKIQVAGLDQKREKLLNQSSIYFEFDSDVIQPEYREILEAHADYLTSHRNPSLILEGHADERGTREYNLALSERRGMVVKRLLNLLGVPAARMRVISYGEERPYGRGHDEESWRLNRRVDIVY